MTKSIHMYILDQFSLLCKSPLKGWTRIPCLAALTLAILIPPLKAQAPSDPFEPTVSPEEADFLQQVLSVSETNTVAAISLLRDERPEEAESPVLDFTLGNLHFQDDRLAEAETAYRAAVKKMPRFRAALMNLGRVLLLRERPDQTIEVYQRLVEDGQATADILMLLGHAFMLEDAPAGAETAYRQALLLRPRDKEIRAGLAKALLRQERTREALSFIQEILDHDPLNREMWSLRVSALVADADHERAIRAIEQARRLDRATPEMLATLGDLWLNDERPADALDAYQEAFAGEAPSIDRMLRAIEGFLMVEDSDGAAAMIDRAREALRDDASPSDRLRLDRLRARAAIQNDQFDKAATLLRGVLERDPLDGRALLDLADLHVRRGETEHALLAAERAARVEGFESEALLRQARIHVSRRDYDAAVPLLESAQAFDPRDSVARYLEQIRRLAKRKRP